MLQTITCHDCGHEIARDDFIMEQCPLCDSYMVQNRLSKKVNPEYEKIIRVSSVKESKTDGKFG